MSNDMVFKARDVFKTLVDLTDEEKMFLEGGNIHELLEKEKLHRQTYEFVRESDEQKYREQNQTRKRYKSNQINFRNVSSMMSGEKVDLNNTIQYDANAQTKRNHQRKLMGQSVEWGRLPFEFDSIVDGQSIITNRNYKAPNQGVRNSIAVAKTAKLAVPDTSFRRNANLYSSIMGKNTKRSIAMSTEGASSIKFNMRRAKTRLATQDDIQDNISPSTNMRLESGLSGARFTLDASELTKKPAINMTISGSSV